MPKGVQPKLLRLLETNEIVRLGSTETRNVAARVVVATNRALATEVREGAPDARRAAAPVAYSWPGNVRQLVHVLARAMFVAPKNVVDVEHIDLPGSQERAALVRYRDAKQAFELEYFTRLMRAANGNVALAARIADKTRKEVYDALKRVGLEVGPYRQGAELDEG